jgi:hypothetical protein
MMGFEHFSARLVPLVDCWLAIGFAAHRAGAELITFRFDASVTEVSIIPSTFTNSVDWPDVGDAFRGTYTFDSNAIDTAADPDVGIYDTEYTDGAISLEVEELTLSGSSSVIIVGSGGYYSAGS